MYENMKPKDAARIFDRLDMKILVDVSTQMNPRKMSDILAQMTPDAAERLTVELANRAGGAQKTPGADQSPKIEGKPSGREPRGQLNGAMTGLLKSRGRCARRSACARSRGFARARAADAGARLFLAPDAPPPTRSKGEGQGSRPTAARRG